MSEKPIQLAIVTVNYKTPDLTNRCIDAVLKDAQALPPFRMFVVDNNSWDGSPEVIGQHIDARDAGDRVELLVAPVNGGYAYGNNVALRAIRERGLDPAYIWFLNPDTEVELGAGKALIDFLDAHPQAGMAGSGLIDADGTPQISAFRFHAPLNEFLEYMQLGILDRLFSDYQVTMPIASVPHRADWVTGASFMITSRCLDSVGLMDEGYFLYYEDVDYGFAAARAGWEVWTVPQSRVFHVCGAATGVLDFNLKQPRRPDYWFESRRRFFLKNYGKTTLLLADIALLTGFSLWRLRRLVQRKPDLDSPGFLADAFRHSVFMKGFSLRTRPLPSEIALPLAEQDSPS